MKKIINVRSYAYQCTANKCIGYNPKLYVTANIVRIMFLGVQLGLTNPNPIPGLLSI